MKSKLLKIVQNWEIKMKPKYRGFHCGKKVRKAYRIWLKFGGIYSEFHFCKNCFLNYENRCFI